MSAKTERNKDNFLIAYKNTLCNISIACEKIGISRRTYYDWCEDDSEFDNSCIDIRERNIDFVESQLLTNIREGNVTAQIFFLKTIGKNRGYIETQELKHSGNTFIIDLPEIDEQ